MSVVHGALWANELRRLRQPDVDDGYTLVEVHGGWLLEELVNASKLPELDVHARLARGCRVWVAWAWDHDEVAAWLWVSTGREWAHPIRRELAFQADECYGWDAGAQSQHRGHGLFAALLQRAGWQMAQESSHLMWGGILDANLASQRSTAAAGFRPVLRLAARLEPAPTTLRLRRADYADDRLVERARLILGA